MITTQERFPHLLGFRRRSSWLGAVTALYLGVAPSLWAQDAAPIAEAGPASSESTAAAEPIEAAPQADVEPEANSIEEIIVTATKRGMSLQEVPASVSSLGGEELERRGVDDVASLAAQVPNVAFGSNGIASFVTIRGVGTTVDSGVAEPSVATYVDGVFLPRATMGFLRQVDLERVEVLRGPQGTLYGRNATAGAMNFISRAPSSSLESGFNLSTGSHNAFGASGYLTGSLSESISARLSGGYETQDGYLKVRPSGREIADTDVRYARAALRFAPIDTLTLDLSIKYEESKSAKAFQQLLTPASIPPLSQQTTKPNVMIADGPFESPSETTIAAATVNWTLGDGVALKSITGYVDHESSSTFDGDATNTPFLDLVDSQGPSESYSQEFNLFGDHKNLTWLVGAYYFKEDYLLTLPAVLPLGIPDQLPPAATLFSGVQQDTESYALFTDLSYALTEALKLNLGLRYNEEKKDFLFTDGLILVGSPLIGQQNVPSSTKTDDLLPKIGVQYEFTPDVNVYAQWQKGIKSGGHQLSNNEIFPGEEITSYEAGAKSRWLDRRLTLNGAVFFYDYSDLQITNVIPPATTLVENADAEILGFEGELVFYPTEQLALNLGVALLDSEYTRFVSTDQANPSAGEQDLSGVSLVRAPDYTISLGAEWNVPVNAGYLGNVSFRAEVFHTDDVVMRYFATANDTQPSYTIANLSALFEDTSGRFQLKLFVNNISDELYLLQDTYVATFGAYLGMYSEPRNWGAQLTARF